MKSSKALINQSMVSSRRDANPSQVRGRGVDERVRRISSADSPYRSMTTLDKDIYYSSTVFQISS
jgi:hypothetical protein